MPTSAQFGEPEGPEGEEDIDAEVLDSTGEGGADTMEGVEQSEVRDDVETEA